MTSLLLRLLPLALALDATVHPAHAAMELVKRAPPGPAPKLNYTIMGSLSYTPAQVIDADTRAINQVSGIVPGCDGTGARGSSGDARS